MIPRLMFAAVGDRVRRRHPFDEADQDGEGEDDENDDEGRRAAVDQVRDETEDDRDQGAFEVEAEDRPPGRMALEDHPLAGVEVDAHAGQHMASTGGKPGHPPAPITSTGWRFFGSSP